MASDDVGQASLSLLPAAEGAANLQANCVMVNICKAMHAIFTDRQKKLN